MPTCAPILLASLLCATTPPPELDLSFVHVVLEGPGLVASPPADRTKRRAELETQRAAIAPRLVAHRARIDGDYRRLVNAVRIAVPTSAVDEIRRMAGVVDVEPVGVYELLIGNAVPRIGAPSAWGNSPGVTGRGVRVAVIDSGIDYLHAHFGGSGNAADHQSNDPTIIEPGTFPTAKVTAGIDLVGDNYRNGGTPNPDPDPIECASGLQSHGTLMGSAIAGFGVTSTGATYRGTYDMSFDPATFTVGPGVAPQAELYAVKISSCGVGTTDRLLDGLEWVVDPNGDGVFEDRPDIINISLGTPFGAGRSVVERAVQTLLDLGVTVVSGMGNDSTTGRGYFAAFSPGTVPGVIAVGATFNEALTFDMVEASGPGGTAQVAWLQTLGSPALASYGAVTGILRAPAEPTGCEAFVEDFGGNIAVIVRGECGFAEKFMNAANAGALATIIVDHGRADRPFALSGASPVPAGMIRQIDGEALFRLMLDGDTTATIDPAQRYPTPFGPDAITGISVRGPSAVDGALKPDLVAPSDPIVVAHPGLGTGAVSQLGGTSIATAIVSGAAALVRERHPSWAAPKIKAALMNNAAEVLDLSNNTYPLTFIGAGRVDVARATEAEVRLSDADAPERTSVSFEAVVTVGLTTTTRSIEIENLSTDTAEYTLRTETTTPIDGVAVRIDPETITLAPGAIETVTLQMTFDPALLSAPATDAVTNPSAGAAGARHFLVEAGGFVSAERAGVEAARLPFFTSIRAAHTLEPVFVPSCVGDPLQVVFDGGDESAGVPPVVGAFRYLESVGTGDVDAVGYAFADGVLFLAVGVYVVYPTPARFPRRVLDVGVDVDRDGNVDYDLVLDGFDRSLGDGPGFRDVLQVKVVPTNELYNPNFAYPFTHLNWIRPDEAMTQPFFNDVWVLPIRMSDIAVTNPAQPIDIYLHASQTHRSRGPLSQFTITPTDAQTPTGDAPMSVGAGPIEVGEANDPGPFLAVALTGAPGARKFVLDPSTHKSIGGTFELDVAAPAMTSDDVATVVVDVRNVGSAADEDVVLVVGGSTTAIGRLEPGEQRTVEAVVPLAGADDVTVSVAVRSRCSDGHQTQVVIAKIQKAILEDDEGCGCTATSSGRGAPALLALLLAFAARRRSNRG